MTIKLQKPDITVLKPRITVFGVGGGGGNAVNNMINAGLKGVDFVVANTDAQALTMSRCERIVQLGVAVTEGLGAGSQPEVGRAAAEECIDEIIDHLNGTHMCFVTAGMGGGTGTGAAPVIAQVAKEMGALTVGVVTKPFYFEGKKRLAVAEAGIAEFRRHVDSLITIPNDRLLQLAPKRAGFKEMLKKADDVLYYAVKGISDLIMTPGYINLDFADVRTIMSESGMAMMGTGIAVGESRAREAAEKAITSPLLEGVSIDGARNVLVSITSNEDLALEEAHEAMDIINEAAHSEVNVIFGTVLDPSAGDELRVTVIATGIDTNDEHVQPAAKTTTITSIRRDGGNGGGGGGRPAPAPESTLRGLSTPRVPTGNAGYNVPAYVRQQSMAGHNPGRPVAHNPGEDDFIFDEDEFETPSFIRKQAN